MKPPAHVPDYVQDIALLQRKSCSKRRSVLKWCPTPIAVLTALLCNFFTLGMAVGESKIEPIDVASAGSVMRLSPTEPDTCRSLECNLTASEVLNRMDANVSPCDDFYRFACGGFINSTPIPDDRAEVSVLNILNDEVAKQLSTMMESKSQPNERESDTVVKDLYKSCVSMTPMAWKALKAIHSLLTISSWPVIEGDRWRSNPIDATCYSHLVDVTADSNYEAKRVIHIRPPKPNSFHKFISSVSTNSYDDPNYLKHMVDIAVILGAERKRAEIELKGVLLLDFQIAKISVTAEEPHDFHEKFVSMTVDELKRTYPNVRWQAYFRYVLQRIVVNDTDTVIVEMPSYFFDLNILGNRLHNNYGFWKEIEKNAYYLNKATTTPVSSIEKISRWKVCGQDVYWNMEPFAHEMYARKYLAAAEEKNSVRIIFEDMKQQLINDLQKGNWMDDETQHRAVEKVEAMRMYLGYDHEFVNAEDGRLILFQTSSWLKRVQNYIEYRNNNERDELPHWLNKTVKTFFDDSYYVAFLYAVTRNSITVRPGGLQGSFFNINRPAYMNYGALGSILAHEITHGFGYVARLYDKSGARSSWVTRSTEKKFRERAKCIIDQYNNYIDEETGLEINGAASLRENFADNGGIEIAYRAYNNRARKNKLEQKLPGLDYTSNQMFWISMATSSCTKYTSDTLKLFIENGQGYVPREYRVLGPLSNMAEFSEDFNCPVGSRMNPAKKCRVW